MDKEISLSFNLQQPYVIEMQSIATNINSVLRIVMLFAQIHYEV